MGHRTNRWTRAAVAPLATSSVRRGVIEFAPPRQLNRYTASLMKYRNLKSIAHNFTHSFVSFMNYVDDGYVIDDLLEVARNGKPISIQWIPDSRPDMSLPPRVLLSIAERKSW